MSAHLLHKKARTTEDAVTGLVVDLVRAWPDHGVLVALLGRAEPHPSATWTLPAFDHVAVVPWPTWASGEPDLVISLSLGGAAVLHIVVESKLGAEKSSVDDPSENDGVPTKDQLAKYQLEATARLWGAPITILYLTHHPTPPRQDLEESFLKMRRPEAQAA